VRRATVEDESAKRVLRLLKPQEDLCGCGLKAYVGGGGGGVSK
jgi:hypothetical protein